MCLFLVAEAGEEPASPQPPPVAGVATGNRVGSTCGRYWLCPYCCFFLRQPGMHLLQLHAVSSHSKRRYDTGRLAAWGSVGVMWVINNKCGRRMQI